MDRSIWLFGFILTLLLLACLALWPAPNAFAVSPPPDGDYPGGNTAEGQNALFSLTTGTYNPAIVSFSLRAITTGDFSTATGDRALFSNTIGSSNTATGSQALFNNTAGNSNTANGALALGRNRTGSGNTALGFEAGVGVTTADNVICIGATGANVSNSCFIGQIFGATSSGGTAVFINGNGKLGTTTTSRRFKEEIKPMDRASEVLFALKPVTFRYKKDIHPQGIPQLALVAEDVEKVKSDLVVRDKEGKPYSVRYDQVNAMLLNEFLKEHSTVQELKSTVAKQEATISRLDVAVAKQETTGAQQQKEIKALIATVKEQAAQIQKVSAQIQTNRSAPRVVVNDQ
jgi:uncharacterized coiled-coil protein SlyX